MPVIEVQHLRKTYGDTVAVEDVSLCVEQGEVFALLGPNGAGKSTTVEIMEGHRTPTAGSVSVLGVDPSNGGRDFRNRIGIVLQSSGIEDELTVNEALAIYGSAYTDPRPAGEVLELVGLQSEGDRRVMHLSGGQQRRVDLALGLVGRPEVLFLDEPTTGFDPAARRNSWDLVAGLRNLGTTIVLTTHYMEEAEYLADRVAIIVKGSIVAEGSPGELMEAAGDTVVTFRLPEGVTTDGLDLAGLDRSVGVCTLQTETPTAALHELTSWALERDIELEDLSASRPSLEDVYLSLAYADEGGQ